MEAYLLSHLVVYSDNVHKLFELGLSEALVLHELGGELGSRVVRVTNVPLKSIGEFPELE